MASMKYSPALYEERTRGPDAQYLRHQTPFVKTQLGKRGHARLVDYSRESCTCRLARMPFSEK